jgi:uncharacterized protein (DUF58 family)
MAARARERTPELPCPSVRFEPDFPRRLQRFAERFAAARERREGSAAASLAGGGHEFVAYRPYRAGEDLRALDWNLLARFDRAYVRVTRREAGERWLVLFDASGSMGAGPPGKLQRAAEVAAALAASALRLSAEVALVAVGADASTPRRAIFESRKRSELPDVLSFLERQRAVAGAASSVLEHAAVDLRGAARVFVLGDLASIAPRDVLARVRAGSEWTLVQILAPLELDPALDERVEWWDPESGERLALSVDERLRASYATELEARLESWRSACAAHRVGYACSSSALAFEDILQRALRGSVR